MVKKVLFIGSKSFGYAMLCLIQTLSPGVITAVVTLDDSQDDRSCKDDFEAFAQTHQVPLFIVSKKNDMAQVVREIAPDLCIVNGWYAIIEKEVLAIPAYGFIGIHHSLLPAYRGGSPLVWQIMNGEPCVGSSLFYFDEGMDSGDILLQVKLSLALDDDILSVRQKLEALMLEEFKKAWPKICNHSHEIIKQNHQQASYCAQLSEEDGQLNWAKSALEIFNQIRAQTLPYPCAFTYYGDKKIKIIKAKLFDRPYYGMPGQVASFNQGGVVVTCGDQNALVITEVMLEDQQILSAKAVLNSLRIRLH